MPDSSSVESSLSDGAKLLMSRVRERYLESRDFNGFHVEETNGELKVSSKELLEAGLVQVVSFSDYPNFHIRPWQSKRTTEEQADDIDNLEESENGFCLYPTPFAMESVELPKRFEGRPFHTAMARGKGTLELAYFEFQVLEGYRNDSRFWLGFGDTGASLLVNPEERHHTLERDRIFMNQIGYGYDLSSFDPKDPDSPIVRRVAVLYCDLLNLNPEIQRRWESYQVESANLEPHPGWWGRQMGEWDMALGPFDRMFFEIENINQLTELIFEDKGTLFKSSERPDELGWILRPSRREWDEFIHQMDKTLSDNLSTKFLNNIGAPKENEEGHSLGTIARLQLLLESGGASKDLATQILKPIKEIRRQRQAPAHAIRVNITDATFVHKQVVLIHEVNDSLKFITSMFSRHSKAKNWENKWKDVQDWLF